MGFFALCYPEFAEEDRERIKAIRARYDPDCDLIGPHVTLVFDTGGVSREGFVSHVRSTISDQSEISFVLRRATVVKSSCGDDRSIFLVPDEGYNDIVRLHDRLYTGVLADHLRPDIPYIPHITVGVVDNPESGRKIVDEINRKEPAIPGRIRSIDIAYYDGGRVNTIEKIDLIGAEGVK